MDPNNVIECGGFYFIHNFDSGNLGHVERVPTELIASSVNAKTNAPETPDYEFNLWTRPDCAGTEFENGNRTWFYFGVQAPEAGTLVRLNLINLNKQGKMYNQGMAPVTRTLPGKPQWERIRDRPVHSTDDNTFTLSFKYRTSDNLKATTFFAFTYPFSFAELQIALNSIDLKMLPLPSPQGPDDIYYCRECLIYSLEGRKVDLLTISSHHGITTEREERLKNLFPENQERPFKFQNKKVIFISARVHPGETPSSFVFNGFLNLLLTRNDPIAIQLRKLYVFKMIPFLNPDGVARGHYRTDTRGVNLNRVYLNPSLLYHPTVYASRALIRYYHFGCEVEDLCEDSKSVTSRSMQNINESSEQIEQKKKKSPTLAQYKGDTYKREKPIRAGSGNKSTTTIKAPSVENKKASAPVANCLVDQVCDMRLQEKPSQTSISSKNSNSNREETSSLLNDDVLRSCLGSSVHISTSEELNIHGGNPLKPLRDALKNSISLLMESSSNSADLSASESVAKESHTSNLKMGWCPTCKRAVDRLEATMPGITNIVPGYSAMTRVEMPAYHSIDEYREDQLRQFEAHERKLMDSESPQNADDVFLCTNCFKRFVMTDGDEICEPAASLVSRTTVGVSCGDTGGPEAPLPPAPEPRTCNNGDSANTPNVTPEKKPPATRAGKPKRVPAPPPPPAPRAPPKEPESGLYLYIDLHGHASKKGIFMYGNHFEDTDSCVECMLLPRIMSLNNLHFHFSSCNFTERNMYLKDRRDGMSREGSGRVAVLKATGLVRSYTLECNYNTGRLVNVLPPTVREGAGTPAATAPAPPKYTPHIFEEMRHYRSKNLDFFEEIDPWKVGRSLGSSILDLTGHHPNSRVPCSEHRNLSAVREWLRAHTRSIRPQLTMSRLRPKASSPTRAPLYARSKAKGTDERKENTYAGAKSDERKRSPPPLAPRPSRDLGARANIKFAKKNETAEAASRARYLAPEPKPKTLGAKRRNVLAVRKPNASKTLVGGAAAASARPGVEAGAPRAPVAAKLSKRSFSRSARRERAGRCRAAASSSSDDLLDWEEVSGGTALGGAPPKRRHFAPPPHALKKIRLKTAL